MVDQALGHDILNSHLLGRWRGHNNISIKNNGNDLLHVLFCIIPKSGAAWTVPGFLPVKKECLFTSSSPILIFFRPKEADCSTDYNPPQLSSQSLLICYYSDMASQPATSWVGNGIIHRSSHSTKLIRNEADSSGPRTTGLSPQLQGDLLPVFSLRGLAPAMWRLAWRVIMHYSTPRCFVLDELISSLP